MKRTKLSYLDERDNSPIAELSRVRNVPKPGDYVTIHSLAGMDADAVKATYEVMQRTWNADGSEVSVVVTRISPFTPTAAEAVDEV